jgi:predicted acylesterase/phospholipase RssA
MGREHDYLVLSGGGGNGAFGAGLLAGWTAHGSRPEFQIVSGVSTGALIAPFAFLGPAYDGTLRDVYTRYSTEDLVESRSLLSIVRGDAALSTARLRALIAHYLDDAVIAAIAAEGARGRSLFVGTTNLDAGRPVVWDITRIAAHGTPAARELIYDVILASTAIPGAFPPVMIQVEAHGLRYDEMHVDGGVTSQLFLASTGSTGVA